MKSKRRNLNSATKPNKEPKLSRSHAPADLSPVEWQRLSHVPSFGRLLMAAPLTADDLPGRNA